MILRGLHILLFMTIVFGYSEVATAQTLTKYVKQKQQEVAKMQRIEKQKYNQACQKGTLEAFKEYLKAYPTGKYIDDMKKRIEDYDLWSKAISENTIFAYNQYLSNSKYKSFKDKAEAAIEELYSKNEWSNVKNSTSISDIEKFMSAYPNSSFISDAKKRKHELLAVSLYTSGNIQDALREFNEAGGRESLQYANRVLYDKCKEFYDYSQLTSNSKESEFESFLKAYPNSEYSNEISNRLALVKAKELNMFSSEDSFGSVLAYAKDKMTKNLVQGYIDSAKRSYRKYKRRQRHDRVMSNGGYVKLGLEILDFGIAGITTGPEEQKTMYCNLGISVKFGNYKAPIQFEVGIKPGYCVANKYQDEDYYYDYKEISEFFYMPIQAKLKVNLNDTGDGVYYVAGLVTYNLVRDEDFVNEYSVGCGVGVAWKKWDWFILYYKQDLENKLNVDGKFLGTSFIYYI